MSAVFFYLTAIEVLIESYISVGKEETIMIFIKYHGSLFFIRFCILLTFTKKNNNKNIF